MQQPVQLQPRLLSCVQEKCPRRSPQVRSTPQLAAHTGGAVGAGGGGGGAGFGDGGGEG